MGAMIRKRQLRRRYNHVLYCINGNYTAWRMQGIVRFARELVSVLDEIAPPDEFALCIPQNAKDVPSLRNIEIVPVGKRTGLAWEQVDFSGYLHRHPDATALNLCNTHPLAGTSGVTVIHDVMYKANPQDYTTLRNKASRLWHVLQYSSIAKREKRVLTVSEFSRKEIEKYYPSLQGKVGVIPNSWEHIRKVNPSGDWQERYPLLKPNDFFFSLSTLSRNKNGKWVVEVAKRNPDLIFAIAGKKYETEYDDTPDNVCFLGFVSDEDAAALYMNCKAFIFPSLYEGFGIPPLEALALGAEVVASNAASMPEVLGDAVHYIDPFDYGVDLLGLLSEPVADPEATLAKFSYENSARLLLRELGLTC